ncbi:hypothetical protein D3C85_1875420 [compost metagenome]
MHAVSVQGNGQIDVIVYDKRNLALPALLLEYLCKLNIRLPGESCAALFAVLE